MRLTTRPPTLQRLKDEVVSKSDVIGGRVRVEQYFEDYDLTSIERALSNQR